MNLALFDFDGTRHVDRHVDTVHAVRCPSGEDARGQQLLIPVAVGYRLGMIPASRGRQMAARIGFHGEEATAVRQLGASTWRPRFPATLRQSALDRIEWHKSQGDDVVVVSASLDVYLGPWCDRQGVDYICTTLEERDGRLTGNYFQGDCSGPEKVRRILQRYELARYAIVYAYGDSVEDREMLELAHKKYYRWTEISSWDEVTSYGHPSTARRM